MIYPVAAQNEFINPEWQMIHFTYLQKDLSSSKISYKSINKRRHWIESDENSTSDHMDQY